MRRRDSGSAASIGRIVSVLCILAAGLALPVAGAAEKQETGSEQQDDGKLKIAVVDLQEVIRSSQRWKDFREKHDLEIGRMERSLEKLKNHARTLKQEYQNLAPGSEEAKEKKSAIEETLQEFRKKKSEYQNKLQQQLGSFLNDTIDRVRDAVETYAERNDVDLVLKKGSLKSRESGLQEANQLIMGIQVLYAPDRMDATDEVTSILDSNYQGQVEVK